MAKTALKARDALSLLNHGPVVLVTSQHRGRVSVITLAWVAPVSGEPPMVAIAVAPARFSHRLIKRSGQFVVNVPGSRLLGAVWLCGTTSGRDTDKFAAAGLTSAPAQVVEAPLIEECLGHLECRVAASIKAGDHTVFLGRVVAACADPALFRKHLTLRGASHTLHHLGGQRFLTSAGKRLEAARAGARRPR
jgi:flavin reductase (DIM6/NTAB) family NADH-FMN oxidoreductase RutF